MEHTTKRPLVLSTPPHVFDGITTQKVMLNVVIALVPTLIASFVIFGWRALLVTAVTTAACVLFEYLWCLLRKTPPDGRRPVRRGHGLAAGLQPTLHEKAE